MSLRGNDRPSTCHCDPGRRSGEAISVEIIRPESIRDSEMTEQEGLAMIRLRVGHTSLNSPSSERR